MSSMPQVSVSMPTFEQCHFIRRQLRERVRQTRHAFTFEHRATALIDFFRAMIAGARRSPAQLRSAA